MIINTKLWKEFIFGHKVKNLSTNEEGLYEQAKKNFNKKKEITEVGTEYLLGLLREVDISRDKDSE